MIKCLNIDFFTCLNRHSFCRFLTVALTCMTLNLTLSGMANADICTGWGSDVTKDIDLSLPSTIDIPVSATTGTILASGTVAVPALVCNDIAGKRINMTDLSWGTGTRDIGELRSISAGLGIRLRYNATGGKSAWLTPNNTVGGSDTQGLDWQSIDWQLVRAPGTASTGRTFSGVLASLVHSAVAEPSLNLPILRLTVNNAPLLVAGCTLATDKSLVVLPDTGTKELMSNGYSASSDVLALITCPADTTISGGMTITLSAPFSDTDPTLVKNTGTARGVSIEVLNGNTRLSASGGTLKQEAFTQGMSILSPGITQRLSVRIVRNPGETASAGSVKGTFTLTLSVN